MGGLLSDSFLTVLNASSIGFLFVEAVVTLSWFLGFGKESTCCGIEELFVDTAFRLGQMRERASAMSFFSPCICFISH